MNFEEREKCSICNGDTIPLGSRQGILGNRNYCFFRCGHCRFTFVANYRADYENIYDENYYYGKGADPVVNYVFEIENINKTIRNYEWKGIFDIYSRLCPIGGRWLDFGCGGGGLVKFVCDRGVDAVGYEDGWIAEMGGALGISIVNSNQLSEIEGSFDFISAIEVLEHVPDPVQVLKQIRRLLKPGGILFLTTGNAEPWNNDLLSWPYTSCPDVHISFYEPTTLKTCMQLAGFTPRNFDFYGGFVDIIKYKVLKALHVKKRNILIDLLPWGVLSRIVDSRHKVTRHPYGVAC